MQRTSFTVEGLTLSALTAGEGPVLLLLHGWPTSGYLWRHTLPALARTHRVIALDLPGFGQSDKPLDASYSFRFYERVLNGLVDQLGVEDVGLAVHDLGGPLGVYWALRNPHRVRALALLNTLVYPQMSWMVVAFVACSRIPGLRSLLASPWGLRRSMLLGLADPANATPEMIEAVQAPFVEQSARKVLLKTASALHPAGFKEMQRLLPDFPHPVRAIYGAQDRILPHVGKTMARVARDLPGTEVTALEGCGHFLQEEKGEEIGELLAEFFSPG